MSRVIPILLICIAHLACDQSPKQTTTAGTTAEGDPRDLTYSQWKRETEAGRGDSLARKLTEEEIAAISAGILSHKGDSVAVRDLTMRELIERGRDVRRGGSGRTQ